MHGILPEEEKILKLIEDYNCLLEEQLLRYFEDTKTEMYIRFLCSKGLAKRQNGLVVLSGFRGDTAVVKAFEVILYYRNEIQNHWPSQPPYEIYFMKGDRHYDIAVIKPGEEIVKSAQINRSTAERVIAVIDNKDQIEAMEIEKPVLFFIPGTPPRLFEKAGKLEV